MQACVCVFFLFYWLMYGWWCECIVVGDRLHFPIGSIIRWLPRFNEISAHSELVYITRSIKWMAHIELIARAVFKWTACSTNSKSMEMKEKKKKRTMRVWLPLRGSSSFASLHFNYHYHHNWNLVLWAASLCISIFVSKWVCVRVCVQWSCMHVWVCDFFLHASTWYS